jgi:hypothetical protein
MAVRGASVLPSICRASAEHLPTTEFLVGSNANPRNRKKSQRQRRSCGGWLLVVRIWLLFDGVNRKDQGLWSLAA